MQCAVCGNWDSRISFTEQQILTPSPVEVSLTVRIEHRSMKVRDALKLIEADGWRLVRVRGSHRQFRHPEKPGRVTIAGKPNDELAPGTLNSILKQAGLKR